MGGQSFCKCFHRGGGMSQHFNGTGFIFSHKPPAGWAAVDSKMTEVEAKKWLPCTHLFLCICLVWQMGVLKGSVKGLY